MRKDNDWDSVFSKIEGGLKEGLEEDRQRMYAITKQKNNQMNFIQHQMTLRRRQSMIQTKSKTTTHMDSLLGNSSKLEHFQKDEDQSLKTEDVTDADTEAT